MISLYKKIFITPKTLISIDPTTSDHDVSFVKQKIKSKVKRIFNGSLAIRVVTAGSTNACEQELTALCNSYYDVDRFGVHFVASPRHADMLIVTGPVTRNMQEALVRTYQATPDPKIVVALGDDAIDGGIFRGSYAVLDGVNSVIPVNYEIPGDPPSPLQILYSLLSILNDLDAAKKGSK